jgi:hypothetical protein
MRLNGRVVGSLAAGLAAAALTAGPAGADPTSLASKEAHAQRVLLQIRSLDSSLSRAIEAYNLANVELERIEGELSVNRVRLSIARKNLRRAESALARRLVTIYVAGSSNSTLEVLLGARTLDEVLNGIETADRVSSQDADVLGEVKEFRAEARARARRLKRARARQAQLVRERAAHKASIESQLGQRRQLLSSIKSEIARMQAAERARQFDCSGFIMYVYAQVGVSLPHNAAMQYGYGSPVSRSQLQPGDLVFFNGLGHNGMYIGGNQFIHSPHTGDVVKISSISGWYSERWVGARRL